MTARKLSALVGVVVLGLSPSYVDWQEEPGKRMKMVLFYAVALTLIYYGLLET